MNETGVIVLTLVVYNAAVLGVGFWAARRSRAGEDYWLGGRNLGGWVASLSSAASSSSAWTLVGVSGAAYLHGLSAAWLIPACWSGFALNWFFVARRLRHLSRETGALSVVELLASGTDQAWQRRLRRVGGIILILALGAYVSSQMQASGKAFTSAFGWDLRLAILVGGGVVLLYTAWGGFWSVALTDVVQGLVMVGVCVVLPVAGLIAVGGPSGLSDGMRELASGEAATYAGGREGSAPLYLDPARGRSGLGFVVLLAGMFGIALGYPGQPHVVDRFMALRSETELARGRTIALIWAGVVYSGMVLAGWCARVALPPLADPETALFGLARATLPLVGAGIAMAAVVSAIMSTVDSQLLVIGGTVARDFTDEHAAGSQRRGRMAVTAVGIAAMAAALLIRESVFNTVLFAWSALGAAFGPLLLVRLYRGPVRPAWALAAMLTGFGVTLAWFFTPALKSRLYELVPAFFAALLVALWGARGAPAGRGADA